jgi:hypothetical protein
MNWQEAVRKQGTTRLWCERVPFMKEERCSKVRVLGIAPFTIDRVEGTYLVEFNAHTGKSLTYGEMYRVPVVAFDLRYPDGKVVRYQSLRQARAAAALMAAERRKVVK